MSVAEILDLSPAIEAQLGKPLPDFVHWRVWYTPAAGAVGKVGMRAPYCLQQARTHVPLDLVHRRLVGEPGWQWQDRNGALTPTEGSLRHR